MNDSKKTKSQLIEKLKKISDKVVLLKAQNAEYKSNIITLNEEVENYRNINELANNAAVIIQNSKIQYFNKSFTKMLCCQGEKIEGQPFAEFVVDEELPRIRQISKWRLEGIETLDTFPSKLKCKNGKILNVEISTKLIKYNDEPAEILVFWDITKRIQIEKTLEQAYKQNELILESISSILIGLDSIKRVTHWNVYAEKTFGLVSTDVLEKPFFKCGIKWDWNKIIKIISECQKRGKPVQLLDFWYKSSSKQNGFLNITITPFGGEYPLHSGYLLLCEDITERKIVEIHLQESQKMESVGQLASGLAHEINTPIQYVSDNTRFIKDNINAILKFTKEYEKLLNTAKSNNFAPELVSEAEKSIQQIDLEYLIEEIPVALQQSLEGLDHISEIVLSMKEFVYHKSENMTTVDINRILHNVTTITRNEWKYVAEIETSFDPDLPLVYCISYEINQVLLNLIMNAIDAISDAAKSGKDEKGTIKVKTKGFRDWIEIYISDTGFGIPKDNRNRIFEPFYTTKEVGKGTGQGLAITYSIIKKHGGKITFETEVGIGTEFKIKLPIKNR
ncbi:ATP-binding protein [Candidatus Latescibacterota bacterium]